MGEGRESRGWEREEVRESRGGRESMGWEREIESRGWEREEV